MNAMTCIHGAVNHRNCRVCNRDKEFKKLKKIVVTKKQKVILEVNEIVENHIEMHLGSYVKSGTYYNVHFERGKLVRELTRFILEEI